MIYTANVGIFRVSNIGIITLRKMCLCPEILIDKIPLTVKQDTPVTPDIRDKCRCHRTTFMYCQIQNRLTDAPLLQGKGKSICLIKAVVRQTFQTQGIPYNKRILGGNSKTDTVSRLIIGEEDFCIADDSRFLIDQNELAVFTQPTGCICGFSVGIGIYFGVENLLSVSVGDFDDSQINISLLVGFQNLYVAEGNGTTFSNIHHHIGGAVRHRGPECTVAGRFQIL